jgi:hypothetical protein
MADNLIVHVAPSIAWDAHFTAGSAPKGPKGRDDGDVSGSGRCRREQQLARSRAASNPAKAHGLNACGGAAKAPRAAEAVLQTAAIPYLEGL